MDSEIPKNLMDANQILSDVTVFSKYAKYYPDVKRREVFDEICDRYEDMLITRYPQLKDEIILNMIYVRQKRILPSMRGMQFAGPAIEKNESRVYNCAFLPIDDYRAFSETMFLLLGGTGVGYSVQTHHIDRLPEIKYPVESQKFGIEDSIEGWADAVKYLMKAYLGLRKARPVFDFSGIRAKGERLVTAGGKAPGPEPLKKCLWLIEEILKNKEEGSKLTSIECHDILCHIADAVLSGGIRRAAMIALFSKDDSLMLRAKSGDWWELNPHRGRSNNSAVLLRSEIDREEFNDIFSQIRASRAGEPGIYFTNDLEWGTNPCCEIALKPFSFCNLTEINSSTLESVEDFVVRARIAAFFGTLQAGITDFHYLRTIWRKTTEEDALIGVGQTGICSGKGTSFEDEDLQIAVDAVREENARVASLIGINIAARLTTVKPSGTTSCVLGTSSGIHSWYDAYYIRRMQFKPNEAILRYLLKTVPYLVKPYKAIPGDYVLEIPQKAPKDSILRNEESAMDFLDRVSRFYQNWVRHGHNRGVNTNNVSATCYVQNHEWDEVADWLWENRHSFNGMSILPYDTGSYQQAPFETITEEVYKEMISHVKHIDLRQVIEDDDETTLTAELSCVGGSCEIVQYD